MKMLVDPIGFSGWRGLYPGLVFFSFRLYEDRGQRHPTSGHSCPNPSYALWLTRFVLDLVHTFHRLTVWSAGRVVEEPSESIPECVEATTKQYYHQFVPMQDQ